MRSGRERCAGSRGDALGGRRRHCGTLDCRLRGLDLDVRHRGRRGRRTGVSGLALRPQALKHQRPTSRMVTSGGVAEWLGRGLQSPVLGFESQRRLHTWAIATTVSDAGCGERQIIGSLNRGQAWRAVADVLETVFSSMQRAVHRELWVIRPEERVAGRRSFDSRLGPSVIRRSLDLMPSRRELVQQTWSTVAFHAP